MGRPSKHRLQSTASLRQRDAKQLVKLSEDSDENCFDVHVACASPSDKRPLPRQLQSAHLSCDADDGLRRLSGARAPSRPLSSECATTSDDSNSSATDAAKTCFLSSVKTECCLSPTSSSAASLLHSAADKLFTVSWQSASAAQSGVGSGHQQQHVLSGGYCCELDAPVASLLSSSSSAAVELCSRDSVVVVPVTASASSSSEASMDVCPAPDVSPNSKWHIAGDRDSPYVSVMALASSCHLFSESCPTNSADDTSLFCDQTSRRYWLEPDLPDENVIFTEKHCEMINQITAAYDRYVQTGTIINETLVTEMKVLIHSALTQIIEGGICMLQ